MARGVNKVILLGNIGHDPEIKQLTSGDSVVNFSLATTETWRDKSSNEMQEKTEWHRVVMYGKLADVLHQYAKKGTKLYVEGAIKTRKWQDKNGVERLTTEIHAKEFQMLDSRASSGSGSNYNSAPQRSENNFDTPARSSSVDSPSSMLSTDLDDEIPF